MAISEIVKHNMANGSYIRKMFEEGIALKKIHGNDKVFDLSIGNPMMEPPEAFKQELRKLVESPRPGMHSVMEDAGYPETREMMAAQAAADTGVKFTRDMWWSLTVRPEQLTLFLKHCLIPAMR